MTLKLCHIFLFGFLLALLLFPQTVGLEVTSTISINGTGVISRESGANTEVGYSGIKYSEDFYSLSLGYWESSTVNYSSDFALYAVDLLNTTLTVDSAFELTNVRQMGCLRHYGLKSRQSYFNKGDVEAVALFAADNCSASFDLAEDITGAGGYRLLVLNSTNRHVKEYLDTARYEGKYDLLISNYIGCTTFPGAETPCGWLECPGGASWNTRAEEP